MAISGPAKLTRSLNLETSESTTLSVTLDNGSDHSFRIDFPDLGTVHEVILLGMRPNETYTTTLTITDTTGRVGNSKTESITTEPLPNGFPVITVLESNPDEMEPGWTLMEAQRKDRTAGFLVILDDQGKVIWYLESDVRQAVSRLLDDGLILTLTFSDNTIRLIDFSGNVQRAWHASDSTDGDDGSIPVDGAMFHHDIHPMANGNFLTSTRESEVQVENFPIDENDENVTATVTIRDEPVIEFGIDGNIVGKWNFLDLLKPTRVAFDAAAGQPSSTDWIHLNGIWYDEANNLILASLRHQDAVVAISRETGELVWILGNHANWEGFEQYLLTPTNSPFDWQYHQHSPMLTSDGNLLLFDNGNSRASPFTNEVPTPASISYSRAVEYKVDMQTMTVEQVWEYGLNQSGESIYTPFIGDADSLENTNNVLVTFGGICLLDGQPSNNIGPCRVTARIIEVNRDTFTKVLDIHVDDVDPATTGYKVYRSDRIGSLYSDGTVINQLP